MKQKHEAFTSAKAKHADLLAQHNRTKEVEEKNLIEADGLRAQLSDAEAAHRNCEKQNIRGLASAGELAAAKALMDGLREKLTGAERMAGLAQDALSEMREEISSARSLMLGAFTAYCIGAKDDIAEALNGDAKICAKLLEAYAAWRHSGMAYHSTRPDFLAGIFNPPSEEEIKSAMAEFKPKHRLV